MELNNQYIGSYIKSMRQRAGLTQSELAERIGVGKKAVSKWEQGRGIPDISLLYNLSLELDVDIESLLAGNLDDIGKEWTGVIFAGINDESDMGEKEWERMISMFLLVGIRDVTVFCGNGDEKKPEELLRTYQNRGFLRNICCTDSIDRLIQNIKEEKRYICLLYQPAFLYGMHLTRYMRRAMLGGKIKALILRQGTGSFMPGICFDSHYFCTCLEETADSGWHLFPMIFDRNKRVVNYLEKTRGNTYSDISQDILMEYFSPIQAEVMERGMLAFSFRTKREREFTNQVLDGIERSQNIRIGNLEDIMKVRGWE